MAASDAAHIGTNMFGNAISSKTMMTSNHFKPRKCKLLTMGAAPERRNAWIQQQKHLRQRPAGNTNSCHSTNIATVLNHMSCIQTRPALVKVRFCQQGGFSQCFATIYKGQGREGK
eukprot:2914046-Amphidinium_carterae.3